MQKCAAYFFSHIRQGLKKLAEHRTIAQAAQDEFVEKRSRFIGYARPVQTEEEATAFIAEMRSKHWDATHNVYAYILREGQIQRYSDDGEPQGTAGIPVLDVLQKSGVTDIVVVVTRYFGGILLGGGGLVRAYPHGASIALKAAGILTMRECLLLELSCDYGQYGRVGSLIPECGGVIDDTEFAEDVRIRFHMAPDLRSGFERKLADATNGQVTCLGEETRYFAVEGE